MSDIKYDYEIDIDSDSTASKVANMVGYNKEVLDVGCSTGYLAEVLTKHFKCRVTGIEILKEAGEKAEQFCEKVIVGNIEEVDLEKYFPYIKFDVIVFADVLEHLIDPWATLKKVRNILKEDGYIVASIPNIAHSSIIIELLNGKFNYRQRGLMDNSHLRFFTKETITDLFESTGYFIEKLDRKRMLPSETEFNADINQLPIEVINLIQNNNEFDTYQFILKASKTSELLTISTLKRNIIENREKIDDLDKENKYLSKELNRHKREIQEHLDVIISKDKDISIYIDNIREKDEKIFKLRDSLLIIESMEHQIDLLKAEVQEKKYNNSVLKNRIKFYEDQTQVNNKELEEKENRINELTQTINNIKEELGKVKFELYLIHKSDFWKLALKYYKIRDNVWPFNKIYKFIKNRRLKKNQIISTPKADKQRNSNTQSIMEKIPMKSNKYDVLFFSIIDWDFRYQRPQHIASYLAEKGHRVFYFNVSLNQESIHIDDIKNNLKIITLFNQASNRVYDIDFNKNINEISGEIDKIIFEYDVKDSVIFVEYPNWCPIIQHLKIKYGFKVIFDYIDDFSGFNTNNKILSKLNDKLFDTCDYVAATSEFLYKKAKAKKDKVRIVRNGTQYEHFNKAFGRKEENKKPVVGYYGAIAEWFDIDKVAYIARERPEWDIVLIGDSTYADISELKPLNNVRLLGEKNYDQLPEYLKSFDICIIPFRADIDLIKATNPVKFYEYLSAGKKIVATEIPELKPYNNRLVYLTNDNEEFVEYIDKCLNSTDCLAPPNDRLDFARSQDWVNRCEDIENIAKEIHELASIIVVTYNNLNYTKECIHSILDYTIYPNYEIIIVDNNSEDGTLDYLRGIEKEYSNIKVILNDENYGFAKGNNIGIHGAQGDYLVLLNNDTVVTKGWLRNLIKHLERDEKLGIIGPVTNSIGNEAKINVEYKNLEEMHGFAREYTTNNFNKLYTEINVLAMFCIAFRRDVMDEVGYLDENYGIGMFEDDDFSYRVKEKGYSLACAEDVFIHHYGSVSFKKLEDENYRNIFEENKEKFEKKWNTKWLPHKYREGVM